MNTFKYHVSCTDGKISVQINLFLLPIFLPSSHSIVMFFFPVGFSSLKRHSQQALLGAEVSSVSEPASRPVENVVLTTKGLQERKNSIEWDDGGKKRL